MAKFLCLCLMLLTACAHTEKPKPPAARDPLDIKGSDPGSLDAKTVFEWQRYYQNPPSPREQESLKGELSSTPSSPSDYLQQARNRLAIGQRSEAKDLYARILKDHPGQLDAQLELTHIYLAENNSERAFDYLSAIRKDLEKTERPAKDYVYRYRFALAQGYIQSQNRKKGHQILTDLIALEHLFIPAYAALAQSYLQINKLDLAEFVIKRGLDKKAKDEKLANLSAALCIRRARFEDARDWLRKALESNPNFVPALINRANLAMQRREYALAENDLKRATQLEPLNAEASVGLGLLYRRTGRMTAAKGALERAVELDPLSATARFHLASFTAEELKDKTTALQLYYDVLQARDDDQDLKNQANTHIQAIRDSRLYQ